ncbi:MFS transporter [Kitasatospora cineracea]|uniref:MFS transporter n=1 Tax=Kitasatospora cineracea TaxID=88074 RepID=UPI0033C7C3EC
MKTIASTLAGRLLPARGAGRTLAAGSFVDSFGSGLFLAVATLYFVGQVGIAPTGVALALAVAGVLGLVSGAPGGRLADRYGVGRVYLWLLLLRAVSYSLYALVDGFTGYFLVTCLATMADRACSPLTQAAVRVVVGSRERNRTMASIRALRNVGYTLGTLVAASAVAAHSHVLVQLLFLANGLTFVVTAACVRRALRATRAADPGTDAADLPADPDAGTAKGEPAPAVPATVRSPFRHPSFMALTVGNALMCLHDTVLVVALPVWVIRHSSVPESTVPILLAVNTALTVGVQVWISSLDMDRSRALRLLWGAAAVLCAACLLFACVTAAPTAVGTVLLGGAVVLLTLGENFHAAAAWFLSDAMAPPAAYARYLGAFSTSVTVHGLLGPALVLGALLPLGAGGWAALCGLFTTGAAGMSAAAGRSLPKPRPNPTLPAVASDTAAG